MTNQSPTAPAARPASPGAPTLHQLSFPALGTTCAVQYATHQSGRRTDFETAVVSWVAAFEARYSRFKPDSIVSRINSAAGSHWVPVDAEMEQMLQLCDAIFQMTEGLLDPTVLPLMRLWDWKAARPRIPSPDEIQAARKLVGWTKVRRSAGRIMLPLPGMALDFGGFGKEYAVDIVVEMAVDHGLTDVLVDFGHDIRTLGRPPGRPAWHIGLEDPASPGTTRGSLAITNNRAVASSGDYLRCFRVGERRYGHIIDPRTGYPVGNTCLQATIVAKTCLQAGVLSTCAFVLGIPAALNFISTHPDTEGLLIATSSRAQTRGFHAYETR